MLERFQQYLIKFVTILLQFILFIVLIRLFIIAPGVINSQSMEPGFSDNNFFVVNKVVYLTRLPERFEVVQFFSPLSENQLVVKRVIGLPGETVIFKQNNVYIKSLVGEESKLDEYYLDGSTMTPVKPGQPTEVLIPEYSYFVLGDNRLYSTDSRDFGPVHRRLITGKIIKLSN